MKPLLHLSSLALLVLSLSACGSSESTNAQDVVTSPVTTAVEARIVDLMSSNRLGADPEVREKSDSYIRAYRSGLMTKAEAAAQFLAWLESYEPLPAAPDAPSGALDAIGLPGEYSSEFE